MTSQGKSPWDEDWFSLGLVSRVGLQRREVASIPILPSIKNEYSDLSAKMQRLKTPATYASFPVRISVGVLRAAGLRMCSSQGSRAQDSWFG